MAVVAFWPRARVDPQYLGSVHSLGRTGYLSRDLLIYFRVGVKYPRGVYLSMFGFRKAGFCSVRWAIRLAFELSSPLHSPVSGPFTFTSHEYFYSAAVVYFVLELDP